MNQKSIAKILVDSLRSNIIKYNGFENFKKTFDSQPGDEYEYDFNGKKYKIVKNEKSWSIYRVTKSKTDFIEHVSLSQCPKVNDVKIYIATSNKYTTLRASDLKDTLRPKRRPPRRLNR